MLRPEGHPLVAAVLDPVMAPMARVRPRVLASARGRVLEVGAGTGLNLHLYGDGVDEVIAIEPDPHMRRRAVPRAERATVPVLLEGHSGEALPYEAGSFDTVVLTWVLCTIPDASAAVAEVHRVLRPGGRVLFAEHTRSRHGVVHGLQRVVDPVWKHLAGGCHLTRDPITLLEDAGLAVEMVRPCGSEWSPIPIYRGEAVKR